MQLTKSDFKTARDCPAKLYYKKLRYPSTARENRYLEYLANAGFVVEKIAQLLFPDGAEPAFDLGDAQGAAAATREWLARTETGTLFEAVFLWEAYFARVDILRKEGRRLRLIEVKSASVDGEESDPLHTTRGGVRSEWKPYVEDALYQAELLSRAAPEYQIRPVLCLVDKAKTASPNWVAERFTLDPPAPGDRSGRARIGYDGDPAQLSEDHPLVFIDLYDDWQALGPGLWEAAEEFAASLAGEGAPRKLPAPLGPHCKECEYRYHPAEDYGTPGIRDGFFECWGPMAAEPYHIIDLYRAESFGGKKNQVIARRAAEGRGDVRQLDPELATGSYARRQRIQIECTRAGREHIGPELPGILAGHAYPLYFVDFEAVRTAVPYYPGLHPFDQICFQWSCHIIDAPGAEARHAEWPAPGSTYPNVDFARSLMDCVGVGPGTVYVWSAFESTALREIRRQIDQLGLEAQAADILPWLDAMIEGSSPRIVDLEKLAKEHYFHPEMRGSTSIKYVLPAVLAAGGQPENPYDSLPPVELADGTIV
ncbi:MAG: DUF2779 domain-containing protein, partial [Spirochaetaceae bacterium]